MTDLTAGLHIRLIQILSLLAVVAALFVWRANTLPGLLDQLSLLNRWRRTGFAPPWLNRVLWSRILELAFWGPTGVGIPLFCLNASDYLSLMDRLVMASSSLDFAMVQRLAHHADQVKQISIRLGFQTLFTLLAGWLLTICLHPRSVAEDDIPSDTNPSIIPADWDEAPAAMWEYRIERAFIELSGPDSSRAEELKRARDSGRWRSDWPTWTRCVVGYHLAVTKRLEWIRGSARR